MVKIREYKLKNDLLEEITFSNNMKIQFNNWGFELGNWYSFFSLEKMGGLNSHMEGYKFNETDHNLSYRGIINLINGKFKFSYEDKISTNSIIRKISLKAVENSFLGDMALRMVLRGKEIVLNENIIKHRGSNLYKEVDFPLNLTYKKINFSINGNFSGKNFYAKNYIRDEREDFWVIHHRIVSKREDEVFIKFIRTNKIIKRSPLLSNNFLKKYFYYIREKRFAWFPFQICSNTLMEKSSQLMMEEMIEFN